MTDEERVDPANAQRWLASCASYTTVVVTTCAEEARMLGAARIGQVARGRVRSSSVRVRVASDEDVDRWLAARRQAVERAAR